MRIIERTPPFIEPCLVIASIAYFEQVGSKRHALGSSGDRVHL